MVVLEGVDCILRPEVPNLGVGVHRATYDEVGVPLIGVKGGDLYGVSFQAK